MYLSSMGFNGWRRHKRPRLREPRAPQLDDSLGPYTEAGCATDRGPRATNQDRCAVSAHWAAISDGAGGHAGGDIAAELAIETVASSLGRSRGSLDELRVVEALADANTALRARRRAGSSLADAAATLTVAACTSSAPAGSSWVVANLGDSPVWHCSRDVMDRLSEEHNVAAELVRSGVLSLEGARQHPGRHVITRALGMAERVAPHVAYARLEPGDLLVLASDGLEVLTEAAMLSLVARPGPAPEVACRLLDGALSAGPRDNVTVAVVRHLVATGPQAGSLHSAAGVRASQ